MSEALKKNQLHLKFKCLWVDQKSIFGPLDRIRMHPHGSYKDKGN